MGFRFRRSIRIAPGIRLNVTRSGLSATLGPRGASIGVGRRGTFLNVGIPGTGVSYRQQLGNLSPGRAPRRESYRALQASSRQSERDQAREEAAEAHAVRETALVSLSNVLSERNRTVYD